MNNQNYRCKLTHHILTSFHLFSKQKAIKKNKPAVDLSLFKTDLAESDIKALQSEQDRLTEQK